MADKLKDRPDDTLPAEGVKAPCAEDFTGGAVERAVLKESLQHPATIYPLAASALALSWTLVIAPTPASLAITMGLAFASASSFVYNYVVKGPQKAQDYVNRLRELRRNSELLSLDRLTTSFMRSGFKDGAKEAQELKTAYEQLSNYLKQSNHLPSVDRFNVLAEESLRQGVRTLEQALAVFTAYESVDVDGLENEVLRWKRRLTTIDKESTEFKTLTQQIDSHNKRIALCKQSEEKLSQLVAESNEIETALQTTYLELVDSGNQNLDDFLRQDGGAATRLTQAVEAARQVEQRLKGDDAEEQAKQNKYIELNSQEDKQQN